MLPCCSLSFRCDTLDVYRALYTFTLVKWYKLFCASFEVFPCTWIPSGLSQGHHLWTFTFFLLLLAYVKANMIPGLEWNYYFRFWLQKLRTILYPLFGLKLFNKLLCISCYIAEMRTWEAKAIIQSSNAKKTPGSIWSQKGLALSEGFYFLFLLPCSRGGSVQQIIGLLLWKYACLAAFSKMFWVYRSQLVALNSIQFSYLVLFGLQSMVSQKLGKSGTDIYIPFNNLWQPDFV